MAAIAQEETSTLQYLFETTIALLYLVLMTRTEWPNVLRACPVDVAIETLCAQTVSVSKHALIKDTLGNVPLPPFDIYLACLMSGSY